MKWQYWKYKVISIEMLKLLSMSFHQLLGFLVLYTFFYNSSGNQINYHFSSSFVVDSFFSFFLVSTEKMIILLFDFILYLPCHIFYWSSFITFKLILYFSSHTFSCLTFHSSMAFFIFIMTSISWWTLLKWQWNLEPAIHSLKGWQSLPSRQSIWSFY